MIQILLLILLKGELLYRNIPVNLHTLFELCPQRIKYEVGAPLGLG